MVSASPSSSVCTRRRGATTIQLTSAPTNNPIPIQAAGSPVAKAAPGKPSNSHPLMSLAPADKAVTAGPSDRPPSIYSPTVEVDVRQA